LRSFAQADRNLPVNATEHHGARDWILVQRSRATPKFRLLCFPYAGGGATIFHGWGDRLPAEVEVLAVRLPGRETRLREPLLTHMPVLIDALLAVLEPELQGTYGLFGHSLGGRIAFELARALSHKGIHPPAHLWISGSRAPQLPPRRNPIHELPEAEFIAELRRYEATPAEVFADPELLEIYLPILRADFALHDTHEHRPGPPLRVPISAFGGVDDPYVLPADLDAWSEHTSARFDVQAFPGGHFFLRGSRTLLLDRLSRDLNAWLAHAR
jgi:surfactin synthase thioesterase subunit